VQAIKAAKEDRTGRPKHQKEKEHQDKKESQD
jgi:hypothetical protein